MIRLTYATTLALTKLRTRKIRLGITVAVSGLLFSSLLAASIVTQGAFQSVESFTREGFGNRYVVSGQSTYFPNLFNDQTVIERATDINKALVADKKAEAKRLGLNYDPASDPPPVQEFDSPSGKQRFLELNKPAAQQAINEYLLAHPLVGKQDMQKFAAPYHPKAFYESRPFNIGASGAQLQVLKDGKETFDQAQGAEFKAQAPSGLDSLLQSWTAMSDDLLRPFTLSGESLTAGKDGSVPMVVPYSAAEELLKLEKLPASASPSEKLERIKQVRSTIKGTTFQACYRSGGSSNLITQAISVQQEIQRNKNKADYQKPDLIYGLPTVACGASPVIRDVRTAEQKKLDANQRFFDEKFGLTTPVDQQTITFRVVGIVPDVQGQAATRVSQIINGIVQSSLGNGWYTPLSQVQANPLLAPFFQPSTFGATPPTYYAEFSAPQDERTFIDKSNCQGDPEKCVQSGKPFGLQAFGSNSLALDSAKKSFGTFFKWASLAVIVLAAVIMMGTVGRMIADSRRETAVFRALGAKRFDLAKVYLLYVMLLALVICVFALLAGVLAAWMVHRYFHESLTVQALLVYNSQNLQKVFSLFGVSWLDVLQVLGCIVGAGLLSSIVPLLRNLRRNPIRDMRDET